MLENSGCFAACVANAAKPVAATAATAMNIIERFISDVSPWSFHCGVRAECAMSG